MKHSLFLPALTCSIALTCFSLPSATAAVLAYSGLNGSPDGDIEGAVEGGGYDDGFGWRGSWDTQSLSTQYQIASSAPLSYGSLQTSAGGEYISGGNAYTNLGRTLDRGEGGTFANAGFVSIPGTADTNKIDQGVLWFSILVRRDGNASRLSIGFSNNSITWNSPVTGNLAFRSLNGGEWGIEQELGATDDFVGTGISPVNGEVDLLIGRFDLNGTDSTAHLWVNPDESTLSGADLALNTADAALTGLDAADISFRNMHFYLGSGSGQGSVDELRFGESYADVTPVIPEPTAGLLLIGGLLTWTGTTRRRRASMRD